MKRILLFELLLFSLPFIIAAQQIGGTYYGLYDDGRLGGDAVILMKDGTLNLIIDRDQYTNSKININKNYLIVDIGPLKELKTDTEDWLLLFWPEGLFLSDRKGYYSFLAQKPHVRTAVIDNNWIISASAFLQENGVYYKPGNMMSVSGLPWASKNGYGIGDRITIEIGRVYLPMLFLNGFISFDNPKLYYENSRLKAMKLTSKKTGKSKQVVLLDEPSFQRVEIRDLLNIKDTDDQILLDIIDVYKGSKYKDLCIKSIIPDFSAAK
jgi:hypothetical protein